MATEYGLFNDEGCVEDGFYSEGEADRARSERYEAEDDLRVEALCHDHEGQPASGCEGCEEEEGTDDEDDE